jgi:type II secretory pathway pseudopilin PulG
MMPRPAPSRPSSPPVALRSEGLESGFTLVETLVTVVLIVSMMAGVFVMYFGFSTSAASTNQYTQEQEQTLTVARVLQADVRSADPLLLVPSSFGLDPNGISVSGGSGTSATDVIALYEVNDRYSPCRPATAASDPPPYTPFQSPPIAANVVWAYDPGGAGPDPDAGTLVRYSYCASTSSWLPSEVLSHVVNGAGAASAPFQVSQDTSPTPATQLTIPASTTVVNQSVPVCGSALQIVVEDQLSKQAPVFTFRASGPLENQADFGFVAC